jgi:hypothetical protein
MPGARASKTGRTRVRAWIGKYVGAWGFEAQTANRVKNRALGAHNA